MIFFIGEYSKKYKHCVHEPTLFECPKCGLTAMGVMGSLIQANETQKATKAILVEITAPLMQKVDNLENIVTTQCLRGQNTTRRDDEVVTVGILKAMFDEQERQNDERTRQQEVEKEHNNRRNIALDQSERLLTSQQSSVLTGKQSEQQYTDKSSKDRQQSINDSRSDSVPNTDPTKPPCSYCGGKGHFENICNKKKFNDKKSKKTNSTTSDRTVSLVSTTDATASLQSLINSIDVAYLLSSFILINNIQTIANTRVL